MSTEVERQVLAQQRGLRGDGTVLAGRGELLEGVVGALDVSGVVLGVVKLHDLAGDVGLKRTVVVVEIGKNVLGHSGVSSLLGDKLLAGFARGACHDFHPPP